MNIDWPVELAENTLYRFRAWNRAYYTWDGSLRFIAGGSTEASPGWCYFKVDEDAPLPPGVAVSTPYQECLPTSCPAAGGPSSRAVLTFSRASGDDPIGAVQYRLSTDSGWKSATPSGSKWTANITPTRSGTYRVYARAQDQASRWGQQAVFDFLVAQGEAPVARWHFDETTGTAVNSAPSGSPDLGVTLQGGAVRDDRGRRGLISRDETGSVLAEPVLDRGLFLNGTNGYASSSRPVLETRSAYSFSAWVRLDSQHTASEIVLSQDGGDYSPFIVAFAADRWFFGVKEADADTGTAYFGRLSSDPAQPEVWTHLAGSYDPASEELFLYVNGRQQGEAASPAGSWSATGAFQIGRYKWADVYQYYFPGSIDEVAVWQRVLTADEIASQARQLVSEGYAAVELVASWDAHGAVPGDVLPDGGTGYGRDLALEAGATLDGDSIVLDGTDDGATSPGPVVDDLGSFTVTTATELDDETLATQPVGYTAQVVGQRSPNGSAWGIWFELSGTTTVIDDEGTERTLPVGIWHFGRRETDGTFTSVHSEEPTVWDGAVRLTGVHDAQAGTLSLYTGIGQQGEDLNFNAVRGTGELAVGMALNASGRSHHFAGRINDVRVWSGAMAGQQQIAEAIGM